MKTVDDNSKVPVWVLIALGALITLVIIALESFVALANVLMEAGSVAALALGAAGCGIWLLRLLGLRDQPRSVRWPVGGALGFGCVSLLVLLLGMLGWMNIVVAHALGFALFAAGLARILLDCTGPPISANVTPAHLLWLIVCPVLAIVLLATALPPGILWLEEARGYDVLEYHLAVPKIFLEQRHITFLSNNVYSNFPLNYEMLALWMMARKGDAITAAYQCQAINAVMMVLFIAAAWQVGRTFSRQAGILAGVSAGTLPWIGYLASIAYVEVGMLAMGMAAVVALLQVSRDPTHARRWALTAGLLAGLSCGFKYTAVVMIALPLVMLLASERKRWSSIGLYAAGILITFAPWMVRNVINTHNPVFPLATSLFGYADGTWDEVSHERFVRGHGIAVDDTEAGYLPTIVLRTIGDWRLTFVPFVLAGFGAIRKPDRLTVAVVAVLIIQFGIWLMMTHLFARFAVVMVLPLLLLAARWLEDPLPLWANWTWLPIIALAGTWNVVQFAGLYYDHTRHEGEPIGAYEQVEAMTRIDPFGTINQLAPEAEVMLVGEARTYYLLRDCDYATVFNQHPLTAWLNETNDPTEIVERLRQHGTTHLLVNFSEIDRFKRTYGFDERIDRALFERLCETGLRRVKAFDNDHGIDANFYEVTDHE